MLITKTYKYVRLSSAGFVLKNYQRLLKTGDLSGTFHSTFIPKDSHRHFLSVVCVLLSNVGAQRSPQRLYLPLQALNLVEEIHFLVLTDSNICMTACNESRFSTEDLLLA